MGDRRDLGRKLLVHDGHLAGIYSWNGDKWIRLHKLVWCGDVATVASSYDITVVVVAASWSPQRWMKSSTMQKLQKVQARHVGS